MYIPQFNYHTSTLCFTLPLVKTTLELYLVSPPRSQLSLVSLNLWSLLLKISKLPSTISEGLRRSTFANERHVQFRQPLHVTKGVILLAVVSFPYDCRLGYPLFDTSTSISLLVWYSLPTTYIFRTRLSEFTMFRHPHFANTCYQLLKNQS
jgi:hypothetical protein